MQTLKYFIQLRFLEKNETWMMLFSLGLLYWLFNPSIPMTLVMIIPLLFAATLKK